MSVESFKRRVFDLNEKLVILDNCVLKIGDYDHFHPGGCFTLEKNYGRDITKYFNGAYKLVNSDKEKLYNHPADAVTICNSMVISVI